MELTAWLLALIWIFIGIVVAGVIALFILRSQDLKKKHNNIGPQGPKGEIGLPGTRGAQGAQGAQGVQSIGPGVGTVTVSTGRFSIFTPALFWVAPTNPPYPGDGYFSDPTPNVLINYEVMSYPLSATVMRNFVTLRSSGLTVTPNLNWPIAPYFNEFGFGFNIADMVQGAPLGSTVDGLVFMGTAVALGPGAGTPTTAQISPVAIMNNLAGTSLGPTSGIRWVLNFYTGRNGPSSNIQVGQQLDCNFQITYMHNDAIV